MKNAWIISIAVLIFTGCATAKPVQQSALSVSDENITTQSNVPKEIKGSGENGRVLHKDYYFQNAKPGDWQMTFNGKPLTEPRYITQGDIDYSLNALASLNKELLDESPGSVRALLDDLFDDGLELPGEPTAPDEVDYNFIHGKVIEYINDIRGGRQTILIVTAIENKALFNSLYTSPPWLNEQADIPPDQTAFTLMKKVNSTENKIFCLNEDIQSTKNLLKTVKEAKTQPQNPRPPLPPPLFEFTDRVWGIEGMALLSGIGIYGGSIGGELLTANFYLGWGVETRDDRDLRLSAFAGGGLGPLGNGDKTKDEPMGWATYSFGVNLEYLFGEWDSFGANVGAGLGFMGTNRPDKNFYPFIRVLGGVFGRDSDWPFTFGGKLYVDLNLFDNGFRVGGLIGFYFYGWPF